MIAWSSGSSATLAGRRARWRPGGGHPLHRLAGRHHRLQRGLGVFASTDTCPVDLVAPGQSLTSRSPTRPDRPRWSSTAKLDRHALKLGGSLGERGGLEVVPGLAVEFFEPVGHTEGDRVDVLHRRRSLETVDVVRGRDAVRPRAEHVGSLFDDGSVGIAEDRRGGPPGTDLVGLAGAPDGGDWTRLRSGSGKTAPSSGGSRLTRPSGSYPNPLVVTRIAGPGRRCGTARRSTSITPRS